MENFKILCKYWLPQPQNADEAPDLKYNFSQKIIKKHPKLGGVFSTGPNQFHGACIY